MTGAVEKPDVTTRTDPSIKCPTLHHYGIVTTQLDVMVEWYAKVVGVEVNLEVPGMGKWVGNDSAHHRIAMVSFGDLTRQPWEEKIKYDRVQHSAWAYPTIADLMESYERIRDLGIRPLVCQHRGISIAFYYRDPDDNSVELLADPFEGVPGKSREHMRTSETMRTRWRPFIDPDRMLMAYKEGASDEELSRRAFDGEFQPDEPPDERQML